MSHLVIGVECGAAGSPCEEPGCPFRTSPTDADAARQLDHDRDDEIP